MRSIVFLGMLLLRTGCNSSAPTAPQHSPPPAAPAVAAEDPLRSLELQVLSSVNRQRQLHRIRMLEWRDDVAEQARLHSKNMMERGFFSHVDPVRGPLAQRLNAAHIRWVRCGENIFREKGLDDPVNAAVDGWMRSPAHREIMLDPRFTHTGVGIAISPDTEYFITQIFIRPPNP
jgi:uncharacterized protein YkwD